MGNDHSDTEQPDDFKWQFDNSEPSQRLQQILNNKLPIEDILQAEDYEYIQCPFLPDNIKEAIAQKKETI